MPATMIPFKEQLINAVNHYVRQMEKHPIASLCANAQLPLPLLKTFARIQYVDSVLWIPMLALIKGKIITPSLSKAVAANILCEAGYQNTPHITLCKDFVESLGEPSFFGDYQTYAPLAAHPVNVMNGLVVGMSENQLAGWLLIAETLVPTLFALFRPAYAALPLADMRYLDEHIQVDADEHAQWMQEAVMELLQDESSFYETLNGIDLGGRLLLTIPDVLYAQALHS